MLRPRKPPSQTWRTFLENHVKTLVSVDFFIVPTIRLQVLYVFLVLAHDRRRIVHFNVTAHPTAEWTAQQLREAFPFDEIPQYLLRDRDGIFGRAFREDVKAMGIEGVLSAPPSPWQRAYVERVIGTIRRECLDHVIVFNEASLYRQMKSFVAFYHDSRTHLSLEKDALPDCQPNLQNHPARVHGPPQQNCALECQPGANGYTLTEAPLDGNSALMPSSTIVPIACSVNHSYLLPLAIMLESLKQHLRPNLQPELYLIHAGIPLSSLAAISSIIETHSIVLSEAQLSAAPQSLRFPREAAAPLLLPELLPPALERILFLDADMLVLQDLANLWETPLDQHVLAAVPDAAVPLCSAPRGVKGWRALGIPHDAPYFNCGVLMIHLGRWRQREVTPRVHQYFETTREPIDFLHQEALNAVLWDDWKPLDSRWNLLASRAGRSYDQTASEAWRQPGIVHFAGRMKPWRAPIGGPFNAPYQKMLERILPLIPSEPPALRDRLYSVYDRHLRAALHPVEQYLWRKRLI